MKAVHGLLPIIDFVLRERAWVLSSRLALLADRLPPVPCAGLELRLDGSESVDLQQRIKGPAERARLARFLRDHAPADADGPWAALAQFCDRQDAATIAEELWLELDDTPEPGLPPLSIFARLPDGGSAGTFMSREAGVARLLAAFGKTLSSDAAVTLARCLQAGRGDTDLSHVGVMLGRPNACLRLIVEGISPDDFGGFVERAGLGAMAALTQARVDELFVYADRIRLALTLTHEMESVIGLECFVGDPTRREPRWAAFLDDLVRTGMCTPELRERVIGWPAAVMPHLAREGWPGTLMADALGAGVTTLSWLDCRISHVKMSLGGAADNCAKAYLGFVNETRDLLSVSGKTVKPSAIPERPRSGREVIARACEALSGARTQAGWWLDYPGFGEGVSDEWVTAYVANACLGTGVPILRLAAERAWTLLARRPREGWGWNLLQPADADSTAWALLLARGLGCLGDQPARRGQAFLARHIADDGGVATYLTESHSRRSLDAAVNAEWHRPHLCVTAAVASFDPLAEAPVACLLREQRPDGAWDGYWWEDRAYTSALAADALSRRSDAAAREARSRAAAWAHQRLRTDAELARNPFTLALALRTALHAERPDASLFEQCAISLAAAQCDSGMWVGSARLRIRNSVGAVIDATDRNGIFTTATVLETLTRLRDAGCLP